METQETTQRSPLLGDEKNSQEDGREEKGEEGEMREERRERKKRVGRRGEIINSCQTEGKMEGHSHSARPPENFTFPRTDHGQMA